MTAASSSSVWYPGFKAAVFTLLVCNAAFFLFRGTAAETLDAAAWLVLLALFELETRAGERSRGKSASFTLRAIRFAAALAVGAAAVGYVYHNEWLDALNSGMWIAVVVLLELEMRNPGAVARLRTWFTATALILYAGLGALVLVWAWRREWFDAYDALLWLTAFAMIEMDILRMFRKNATA